MKISIISLTIIITLLIIPSYTFAGNTNNRIEVNFNKTNSRYIYTELKVNNLQYKGKKHSHDGVWLYYNPNGSLRGRIEGTFNIKPKWATSWIYRGWGWANPGEWPVGTYRVKLFLDGEKIGDQYFTIY